MHNCILPFYFRIVPRLLHILLYELQHSVRVLLFVVTIRIGVLAAVCYPECLRLRFRLVERIHHPGGHKRIVVAVYKKHRLLALRHLLQWRCLIEVPAVLNLHKPRGSVHQWEVG